MPQPLNSTLVLSAQFLSYLEKVLYNQPTDSPLFITNHYTGVAFNYVNTRHLAYR